MYALVEISGFMANSFYLICMINKKAPTLYSLTLKHF